MSDASQPLLRMIGLKRIGLVLLGMAALVSAGWFVGYLRQPRYQGVTLNGWLREFDHAWDTSIFADPRGIPTQAVVAVRSIGPAAVPELMSRLRREDSVLKFRVNEWLEKQSLVAWRFTERRKDHSIALLAFEALGAAGADAVPELTSMLKHPAAAERAVAALGCIGQPAIPVLLRTLTHTNFDIRIGAVGALSGVAPVTAEVLDGVLPLVEDPIPRVRQYAVYFVGGATNHLAKTLPVQVGKLSDSDATVRRAAIKSFRRAGDRGREFIPNLLELFCGSPDRTNFSDLHHELKALGARVELLLPCLVRALDASDAVVRNQAMYLLSTSGRDALTALPRLREKIEQTTDADERARLTDTVNKIESPEKPAADYATNRPPRRSYPRPSGPPPIRPQ